jgi:glycosyltransferase involved in cell wall biosynthesis
LPALRSKPYAIIPHGHYKPVLAAADYLRGRSPTREKYRLPQDRFIYLYFGQIRDYKNVELLVEEFLALNEPDALLLIAGSCGPDEARAQRLQQTAATHDNIRLDLRHVPEEVLFEYLEASNLVVLPYKRILNSGSVMMALSAARPVLAPNVGSIIEVGEQVGGNWLIRYDGDFTREALASGRAEASRASEPLDLAFFDWQPIAQQTVAFYRSVKNGA